MARLPSQDSLGALPDTRPVRAIAHADGSAISKGVEALGNTVAHIGDRLYEQKQKEDAFDAERRFQEFKWSEQQGLDAQKEAVKPGEAEGFADRWAADYQQRAREFKQTIPDHLKPQYDNKLFGAERELFSDGARFARGEQKRFSVNALDEQKNRLALTSNLDQARNDYDSLLKANPYLSPIEKDEIRRKHLDDLEHQNVEWRIGKGEDLGQILRDLQQPEGSKPTTPTFAPNLDIKPIEGIAPPTKGPRQSPIEGVVIHHTAGSTLNGALEHGAKTGTGATYYVDRDGSVLQWAPDDQRTIHIQEPKAKARNGKYETLGNDNSIGIEVVAKNDKDVTPEQRAALDALLGKIVDTHRIDPNNIIGHGEIQGAHPFANREADEGTAAAKGFRESRSGARLPPDADAPPERIAQAETGTVTDAASPRGSGKYIHLDPKRRAALIYKARIAQSDTMQTDLKDSIKETARTGVEPVDANGKTAYDRTEGILQPNQRQKARRLIDQAKLGFEANAPLADLTDDEAAKHLEKFAPAPGNKGYAASAEVYDKAQKNWQQIKQLRAYDPIRAISGGTLKAAGSGSGLAIEDGQVVVRQGDEHDLRVQPAREVTKALDYIKRNQGKITPEQAQTTLIDAYRDAQVRLGIAPDVKSAKIISRADADRLMMLPKEAYKDQQSADYINGVKAAADRFAQAYPPQYAKQAFQEALGYHLAQKDDVKAKDSVIAKAISNVIYSPERQSASEFQREMNRARSLSELDRTSQLFNGQESGQRAADFIQRTNAGLGEFPATAFQSPDRPAIATPRDDLVGIADYASSKAKAAARTPSEKDIDWALANPARRARFDKEFGDGAYARELAKRGQK